MENTCKWCDNKLVLVPMECGIKMPMLCETCGTKAGSIDYRELSKLIKPQSLGEDLAHEDKLKDAIEKVYQRLSSLSEKEFRAKIAEAQKGEMFFALLGLFEGATMRTPSISWEVLKDNCRHHPTGNTIPIFFDQCNKTGDHKCTQESCPAVKAKLEE